MYYSGCNSRCLHFCKLFWLIYRIIRDFCTKLKSYFVSHLFIEVLSTLIKFDSLKTFLLILFVMSVNLNSIVNCYRDSCLLALKTKTEVIFCV